MRVAGMTDALTLLSFGSEGWGDEIARGTLITVSLALASLPFGLVIGFVVALGKKSQEPSLRTAANIYTTIFRGLPELLTLFLVYYGVQILLNKIYQIFVPGGFVDVNAFVAGMVCALSTGFLAENSRVKEDTVLGIVFSGMFGLGLLQMEWFFVSDALRLKERPIFDGTWSVCVSL